MAKYWLVGIFNFLFGLAYTIIPLFFLFLTLPRLSQLYTEFAVAPRFSFTSTYLVSGVALLLGLANLFLGFKLFTRSKEKYFKFGLIVAVVSFILSFIVFQLLAMSAILPLYNLTAQF